MNQHDLVRITAEAVKAAQHALDQAKLAHAAALAAITPENPVAAATMFHIISKSGKIQDNQHFADRDRLKFAMKHRRKSIKSIQAYRNATSEEMGAQEPRYRTEHRLIGHFTPDEIAELL